MNGGGDHFSSQRALTTSRCLEKQLFHPGLLMAKVTFICLTYTACYITANQSLSRIVDFI